MVKLSQSMKNLSKFDIIKHQLSKLQSEINSFDTQEKNIPELIDKANLLRQNELLKKIIEKKSSLNSVYTSYIYILEQLLIKSDSSEPKTRTNLKKQKKLKNKKRVLIKRNTRRNS